MMNESVAPALGLSSLALLVVLYVWMALALSALFRKAGEEGWKGWVPYLNSAVLLRLGGFSPWLILLILIPGLGAVVVYVLYVVAAHRINAAFGYGGGMTVLAALVPVVWASVLGFGTAQWISAPAPGPLRSSEPAARPAPVGDVEDGAAGGYDSASASASPTASTAPPSAPPAPAPPLAPITSVPGVRPAPPPPAPPAAAPVTDVPAAPPAQPAPTAWAAPPPSRSVTDTFPELSEAISAVAGAPDAGAPRSARSSVSALYADPGMPDEDFAGGGRDDEPIDRTIIARRRRTPWKLVPPSGPPIDIGSDVVILGRRPEPDPAYPDAQLISIPDETRTVSKTHARLELRGDTWYVTDLGSTNGVLFATLMGTEVEAQPGQELEAGERFFLGDAEVRLRRSEP